MEKNFRIAQKFAEKIGNHFAYFVVTEFKWAKKEEILRLKREPCLVAYLKGGQRKMKIGYLTFCGGDFKCAE